MELCEWQRCFGPSRWGVYGRVEVMWESLGMKCIWFLFNVPIHESGREISAGWIDGWINNLGLDISGVRL